MSNLKNESFWIRAVSGIVFFVVMVGLLLLSYYTFALVMMFICAKSMKEFYNISRIKGCEPQENYGVLTGIMIVIATAVTGRWGLHVWSARALFTVTLIMLAATFVIELYRKRENPIYNIAVTLTGVIYVALPLSLLLFLSVGRMPFTNYGALFGSFEYNPWVILCYFIIVWSNDVGAYLAGITLGKNKLFKRISPNKTWEGFFGGILTAIAMGALGGWFLGGTSSTISLWIGAAIVVAVTGVLGDLVASMFKRSADLKDSGSMLPGHGGYLDRFDAMLYSAPFVFLYFAIFV